MQRRPQDLSQTQLEYYSQVNKNTKDRELVEGLYAPKETGAAFEVPKHHVVRIICSDGPQVCDFNAFARDDASEHFWSARTRTLHGTHARIGCRLWGTEPKMRPMLTLIGDTVTHHALEHNARTHDFLYSRCSPRTREVRTGVRGLPNCNDNLRTALRNRGFPDSFVHDAFNIFMTTGVLDDGNLFYLPSQAKKGDYVELYAEIDTLCAISCCPSPCNDGDKNHGLSVEVFRQPMRHDW
jgi:uncharacterized protein